MKALNKKIARLTTGLGTGAALLTSSVAKAQVQEGITAADTGENPADIDTIIQNSIQVLLFVVGVASVVMLIVGGIRYIASAGDQQAVAGAKNTIIYAIVGLIIAVLAWVAVDFVFNLVTTGSA